MDWHTMLSSLTVFITICCLSQANFIFTNDASKVSMHLNPKNINPLDRRQHHVLLEKRLERLESQSLAFSDFATRKNAAVTDSRRLTKLGTQSRQEDSRQTPNIVSRERKNTRSEQLKRHGLRRRDTTLENRSLARVIDTTNRRCSRLETRSLESRDISLLEKRGNGVDSGTRRNGRSLERVETLSLERDFRQTRRNARLDTRNHRTSEKLEMQLKEQRDSYRRLLEGRNYRSDSQKKVNRISFERLETQSLDTINRKMRIMSFDARNVRISERRYFERSSQRLIKRTDNRHDQRIPFDARNVRISAERSLERNNQRLIKRTDNRHDQRMPFDARNVRISEERSLERNNQRLIKRTDNRHDQRMPFDARNVRISEERSLERNNQRLIKRTDNRHDQRMPFDARNVRISEERSLERNNQRLIKRTDNRHDQRMAFDARNVRISEERSLERNNQRLIKRTDNRHGQRNQKLQQSLTENIKAKNLQSRVIKNRRTLEPLETRSFEGTFRQTQGIARWETRNHRLSQQLGSQSTARMDTRLLESRNYSRKDQRLEQLKTRSLENLKRKTTVIRFDSRNSRISENLNRRSLDRSYQRQVERTDYGKDRRFQKIQTPSAERIEARNLQSRVIKNGRGNLEPLRTQSLERTLRQTPRTPIRDVRHGRVSESPERSSDRSYQRLLTRTGNRHDRRVQKLQTSSSERIEAINLKHKVIRDTRNSENLIALKIENDFRKNNGEAKINTRNSRISDTLRKQSVQRSNKRMLDSRSSNYNQRLHQPETQSRYRTTEQTDAGNIRARGMSSKRNIERPVLKNLENRNVRSRRSLQGQLLEKNNILERPDAREQTLHISQQKSSERKNLNLERRSIERSGNREKRQTGNGRWTVQPEDRSIERRITHVRNINRRDVRYVKAFGRLETLSLQWITRYANIVSLNRNSKAFLSKNINSEELSPSIGMHTDEQIIDIKEAEYLANEKAGLFSHNKANTMTWWNSGLCPLTKAIGSMDYSISRLSVMLIAAILTYYSMKPLHKGQHVAGRNIFEAVLKPII